MVRMVIYNLAYSVTNKCNLRCKHCYAGSEDSIKGELNIEQISKLIIDEAKAIDTRFITLTGGEPLVRPDIFEMIRIIKKSGIRVCLATNGMLLDEEKILMLKELQVDRVQISLEGPSADYNDMIRGRGVFEKIVSFVIPRLIEMGLFVAVSQTPTNKNYQTITEMANLCYRLGVNSYSLRRFSNDGRAVCNDLQMGIEENIQVLKAVYELRNIYKDKMHVSTGDPLFVLVDEEKDKFIGKKVIGGCTAGITSLAIDSKGNIKPCTRAKNPIGNVLNSRLSVVWKDDPLLRVIRNRFLLEGKCSDCKYKMICGGCRVAAFNKNDNIMAEDPQCWL